LKALELYEQAFAILGDAEPRDNFVLRRYMGALANHWMMRAETGALDEAAPHLQRLLATAEAVSDLSYQCIAHFCFSRIGLYRGDAAEAARHARAAIDGAERLGVLSFRAAARGALGGAVLLGGDPQGALAAFDDAERVAAHETLTPFQRLTLLARTAEAHAAVGRLDSALALSEEAVGLAASIKRLPAADAFLGRARVLLALSDTPIAEIERMLDGAADVVRHCAAGVYEPAIHEQRAHLARRCERLDDANRELQEALRLYRKIGASGHAARLAGATERTVTAA
jgi:tetratricopeptide (TPR) repeat protein